MGLSVNPDKSPSGVKDKNERYKPEALGALRSRELAAMTDDDTRRAIADLFTDAPMPDLPPRTTSGLVEQQRLFARLRKPA
jgi:hypothetical protein